MAQSLDAFSLDGKVAIVTGAGARANSIGEAYAIALAEAGASIVVADLSEGGAQSVADTIVEKGGQAVGVKVDITDESSVAAMAERAGQVFGGVDILVNNAALMVEIERRPVSQTPLDEWNRVMNVNVTGALNCAKAVIPGMLARGGGKIVNQVSGGAFPPWGIYGISKLALVGLTTALAREVGRKGINVNAIAPGMTDSSAGASLTPPDSPLYRLLDKLALGNPAGRTVDLAGALLLLCSSAGDWIHGQVLHVDGGWVVRP